jgi:hypothetical protein
MADNRPESYSPLVKLLGVATLLYVIYGILVFALIDGYAERGQFGDLFGGINALFTTFAFAGLIYTASLQREELGLQREELRETRKELAGQREQLRLQNETFRLQSFDTTFFQLLSLHHQIVAALVIERKQPGGSEEYRGRYAFEEFYRRIRLSLRTMTSPPRSQAALSEIDLKYREVYDQHQSTFGHYFRSLYHIFKFIDQSTAVEKRMYASLARAQLSSSELACVFYNCLSQNGVERFKPLAERYTLFKNLPWEVLAQTEHIAHYEGTAFFSVASPSTALD